MNKFYKFKDRYSVEEYNKPYVYVDGLQISYPSQEVLLMAGIKPLVVEDVPQYDEGTQYIEAYYEDGETYITQKWNVFDMPVDEEVIDDESITDA